MLRRAALVAPLLIAAPSTALATDYDINPSMNYRQVLNNLQPGDTVYVQPGEYTNGFPIREINGTAQQPILISGPSAGPRAVIVARSCCNTISVFNASYIHIQSLDLEGRGEFVDAVKAESDSRSAHHITLEDLHITGHGSNQQAVGISTKCPAWDWTIRYNVIEGAGTGIYLGNSDGADPFVRGLIEYNVITDPVGYCMEIKHQIPRPNLAGMPTGENSTIIRHNVFSKANNASTGGLARPNLLVGHWPRNGQGQNDLYEIYGNFFYQNETRSEALFQGEGNIAFHDNVMVNTFGDAVRIQSQNDDPRQIAVYHNTVWADGRGVSITGTARGFTPLVVGNAIFGDPAINNPDGTSRDNITGARGDARQHVNNASANLSNMDFYPQNGALSGNNIDLGPFASYVDSNLDFNGRTRPGNYRGAYAGDGANPGWMLALDTKPGGMRSPGVPPPGTAMDAGFPVDTGTAIDAGVPDPMDARPNEDAVVADPQDSGPAPLDAGIAASDARPSVDGTILTVDTGAPEPPPPDPNRRATTGGCRCVPSPRGSLWTAITLLGIFAFCGFRRRD